MVDITGNPGPGHSHPCLEPGITVSAVCHGRLLSWVSISTPVRRYSWPQHRLLPTAEESGYAQKDVPFDLEGALREEGAIYEATDRGS